MSQRPQADERVWAVVEAGRRIADGADELGREARRRLLESSGLSEQGVALALERLETQPSAADIERLVARAGAAVPRAHVVLSANICIGAVRALSCAAAVTEVVKLRPSRRDPVLAELLVQALRAEEKLTVELVETLSPRAGELVQLYGSDESLRAIRRGLDPDVLVQSFGTGLGVAVVAAADEGSAAAQAIAQDVVVFDQRGCLSPRFVLCDGDEQRAARIAELLHHELTRMGNEVPRGPLAAAEQAELSRHRQTCGAVGKVWLGSHHCVTLDPAPQALLLPPPARCIHLVPVDAATVATLMAPWRRHLTIIGSDHPDCAVALQLSTLAPEARRCGLGSMQSPPLDGPVDLRAARGKI